MKAPTPCLVSLLAGLVLFCGIAHAEVLFSTGWNNPTNTANDSVGATGGTALSVAITGAGNNAVAPASFWTVTDSSKVDLSAQSTFTAPASITGGSDFFYGATSGVDILRKGAILTTRSDFTYTDGTNNATIRYSTNNTDSWMPQFNATAVNDGRFNMLFDVKASAGSLSNWQASFNYGTAGTTGAWTNGSAAQNGTATVVIYSVNTSTGVVSTALSFDSANLSGSGPQASLNATNANATLGEGTYLLSILLTGKTLNQRYTIDNLTVSASAVPEPSTYAAILAAASLVCAVVRRRKI